MKIRNTRTFERIRKMIMKGDYDKEELMLDMTDFLHMGTLTEKEYADLLELIEQCPTMVTLVARASMNEDGVLVSDNTYLLLQKQIIKKVYNSETI